MNRTVQRLSVEEEVELYMIIADTLKGQGQEKEKDTRKGNEMRKIERDEKVEGEWGKGRRGRGQG